MSCLRFLESDLLSNTQNSFGTSRSVLDKSCFGLRPFPCVKGATRLQRSCSFPDTSGTRKVQRTAHTVQQQTMHDGMSLCSHTSCTSPTEEFSLPSFNWASILQSERVTLACWWNSWSRVQARRWGSKCLCWLFQHMH